MEEQVSEAQKFPMADINPDAKQALYIGILESRLAQNEILLTQYRALLEALTGEKWDAIDTSISAKGIKKTATNAFERRLARDIKAAEALAEKNIATANEK